MDDSIEPPLGVQPEWLWNERRMVDLCNAMERYTQAGIKIPGDWLFELNEVTYRVAKHYADIEGKTVEEIFLEAQVNLAILDSMKNPD